VILLMKKPRSSKPTVHSLDKLFSNSVKPGLLWAKPPNQKSQ
jgi:hypothetical protein